MSPVIPHATFVYRGQLLPELSRIKFLLDAVCRGADTVEFIYLAPEGAASESEVSSFVAGFPKVTSTRTVGAKRGDRRSSRSKIRGIDPRVDQSSVIAVGFGVGHYLPWRRCLAWCLNGIPEERLLHGRALRRRVAVGAAWVAAAADLRPRVTVAVSEPMAKVTGRRTNSTPVVIPNAVDLTTYTTNAAIKPLYLTYQGGGSPWQGLDRLAKVWTELYRQNDTLRFRIISQDPRTSVLAEGLPEGAVNMVSAPDPMSVAALLNESRLGFLFREPNVVNQVSWPMKLGEYLGAGAPVVVSRCGWDAEKIIEEYSAGLVLDWDSSPDFLATAILDYLNSIVNVRPPGVAMAASALDYEVWCGRLSAILVQAYSQPSKRRKVGLDD